MIGNDVVDLGDAESQVGAQHPGFDARVFGDAERERIACAEEEGRVRWSLWAGKEAAYKALRRLDPHFVFSPRSLAVEFDALGDGSVRAGRETLALRVESEGERVVAVARRGSVSPGSISAHHFCVRETREALHTRIGERLLREARERDPSGPEARLERVGRIPVLCLGARRLPVSIAHHGRFASAAVLWDEHLGSR